MLTLGGGGGGGLVLPTCMQAACVLLEFGGALKLRAEGVPAKSPACSGGAISTPPGSLASGVAL